MVDELNSTERNSTHEGSAERANQASSAAVATAAGSAAFDLRGAAGTHFGTRRASAVPDTGVS